MRACTKKANQVLVINAGRCRYVRERMSGYLPYRICINLHATYLAKTGQSCISIFQLIGESQEISHSIKEVQFAKEK